MNVKKVSISTNGVLVGKYKIVAFYLAGGTANSTAIVYDNESAQSGDEVIKIMALANDGNGINLGKASPTVSKGVSVTMAGTGAVLYIFYI